MASLNRRGTLALFIISQALLLQVQTLPLQAESLLSDQNQEKIQQTLPKPDCTIGKKGIATYYAKKYHGKRTASGSKYSPQKLTAAHQSLPLGTKVKIVNLANKNEVHVTVNDRCRKRSFPFIDLSQAAAEKLGFFGKGTAKVLIIPLHEES
ncbi:MAG: septal ring lytic transglycosylase RlpA family protein [Geobacteraceae bacterium]|nr:septal ring lytic transglycosylase RlpA family protein [Geobacteraceae bacterium]